MHVITEIIDDEVKKHITAVQKAIDDGEMLDDTIVHGVVVGAAHSGKNCLMERLLGRMPSAVSPSNGVAESIVQVKVMQKSIIRAINVKESVWSVMDYDDEAIKLMVINSESQNEFETSSDIDLMCLNYEFSFDESHSYNDDTPSSDDREEVVQSSGTDSSLYEVLNSCISSTVNEIFEEAARNKRYKLFNKEQFEGAWTLYLTNTGGQMEFQEVLPLLVSGPSIFFFVFRLDRKLNEYYTIKYELSDGKTSYPYTSTLSTIDGMLQTLASISAMDTYIYQGLQKSKKAIGPKVFFIGTHRDMLDSKSADSHIACVDQELKKIIKSTTCYEELVEFASESQLIFAVDNFSESDSNFRKIRLAVQRVVTRSEFQISYPTKWLIFSLAIRKLNDRVISYSHCVEIARRCGIIDEIDEALKFIHSRMGVIRYFQYEHTKDFVFIDPQFLFDKVTELIVSTYTFENVTPYEMEQFKHRGIFNLDKVSHIRPSTVFSLLHFGKLLEKLQIIAPVEVANEVKYFLPCVLAHACKSGNHFQIYNTLVPTLLISFECGFIPKGVTAALIKYLIANEMESPVEWTLLTDKMFKDEISFCVGPYDTLILRMFPKQLYITCIPDSQFTHAERLHCSVKYICNVVLNTIDSGIRKILKKLNYIKTDHHITVPCTAKACKDDHPAQLNLVDGSPCTLQCNIINKRSKLPKHMDIWEPAFQFIYKQKQKHQDPIHPLRKLAGNSEMSATYAYQHGTSIPLSEYYYYRTHAIPA